MKKNLTIAFALLAIAISLLVIFRPQPHHVTLRTKAPVVTTSTSTTLPPTTTSSSTTIAPPTTTTVVATTIPKPVPTTTKPTPTTVKKSTPTTAAPKSSSYSAPTVTDDNFVSCTYQGSYTWTGKYSVEFSGGSGWTTDGTKSGSVYVYTTTLTRHGDYMFGGVSNVVVSGSNQSAVLSLPYTIGFREGDNCPAAS